MAQVVPPPHGRQIYPWQKWTDGKDRTVRKGRDFLIGARSFANSIYKHASDNGLKVTVRVLSEKAVWFQFDSGA